MADLWRDFWIRETWTGQQVAQLHDSYMMMMMMTIFSWYCVSTQYFLKMTVRKNGGIFMKSNGFHFSNRSSKIRETGTGQQVAQLHDNCMMMMMMMIFSWYCVSIQLILLKVTGRKNGRIFMKTDGFHFFQQKLKLKRDIHVFTLWCKSG